VTRYYIGLGSNVGDRLDHLVDACREIGESVRSLETSSIYETEPVGGPDQEAFLNAVAAINTDLEPLALLDLLQGIEARHGRERTVRWGPRTLDLDIVSWDGPPYADDRLTIPHPRAAERGFVLEPLAERWPDADVGGGRSADEALAVVDREGVDFLAKHWIPPVSHLRANLLVAGQIVIFAAVAAGILLTGSLPVAITVTVALGVAALLAGIGVMLASARLLGPSLTASPLPAAEGLLVESGPYRIVRHPIYTGVCLTMIGTALLFSSVAALAAALALVPYLWFKTLYEERQLRMRYIGYRAYQSRVPWRLVPYVT
jgi:2-amino-4-hydroxy-6-hydroxymethyldihydropteridine diphosphokinase